MQYTDEHTMFRSSVREMLAKTVEPHLDEWEEQGRFPGHELFPEFAKLGLLGLEYDPAYGGEGADHWFTVIACEEFGRLPGNGIPMAYNVQTNMATPSLHAHGSDQLKREFLAPAIAGEQICSIAVTEPDAGSDVAGIRTRAERDGGDWLISGAKTYITNGVQGDWLCLLVRTSDEGGYRGMSQVIVPTATPGLTVSRSLKKLGNWCSDTAELTFDRSAFPSPTPSARSAAASRNRWNNSRPSVSVRSIRPSGRWRRPSRIPWTTCPSVPRSAASSSTTSTCSTTLPSWPARWMR